jgi:hypothetical protein
LYEFGPSSSHIPSFCVSALLSTRLFLLAGHWLRPCAVLSRYRSALNAGHQVYTPFPRKMSQRNYRSEKYSLEILQCR